MAKKSQKLNVPIKDRIFKDFYERNLSDVDFEKHVKTIGEEDLYVYNLILRRIRLSDNLRRDDVFTYVNTGVGLFEEAALRLHLYVSCMELIGRLVRKTKFVQFDSWLNAKREPYKSEKAGIDSDGVEDPIEIARNVHRKYLEHQGVRTHFHAFIHEALTEGEKDKLLANCWVLKAKPLPNLYDLQWVDPKEEYDQEDWKIAADGRKVWERQQRETKLISIAEAFYSIRNLYTHSLIPYTSVQDKTPLFPPSFESNPKSSSESVVNRGDTIFVFEQGVAISFRLRPTVEFTKELVEAGIRNDILSKYPAE